MVDLSGQPGRRKHGCGPFIGMTEIIVHGRSTAIFTTVPCQSHGFGTGLFGQFIFLMNSKELLELGGVQMTRQDRIDELMNQYNGNDIDGFLEFITSLPDEHLFEDVLGMLDRGAEIMLGESLATDFEFHKTADGFIRRTGSDD